MQLDDLKEYFDKYVLNFAPYEDRLLYSQISSFLLNYYLTHSYSSIPSVFKSVFENQQIPIELYDTLLLSNGFPKEIVNKISFLDKYILLFSFMDYNRYKGSIDILKKVCNSFSDTFNLYELFIDYDKNTGEWFFIPYVIHINDKIAKYEIEDRIPFDSLVDSTKNFFIDREYLDTFKNFNIDSETEGSILFPIKTNLLYTDYKNIDDYNEINKLIFCITFNHFKSYKLVLYFDQGAYQTNFENIYKLWFYIFLKVYPVYFGYLRNTSDPLFFNIQLDLKDKNGDNLTIDRIPEILSKYNQIRLVKDVSYKATETVALGANGSILYQLDKDGNLIKDKDNNPIPLTKTNYTKNNDFFNPRKQLTDFYEFYFYPLKNNVGDNSLDSNFLIEKYKSSLPEDLVSYIDSKLNPSLSIDELRDVANVLLNSIKTSLITWSYSFQNSKIIEYNKYLLTFMDQLPFIKVNFNKTTSYYLLNFLKPYHAELVIIEDFLLSVSNKFNSVYIDDWKFSFGAQFLNYNLTQISDYYQYNNQYFDYLNPVININYNQSSNTSAIESYNHYFNISGFSPVANTYKQNLNLNLNKRYKINTNYQYNNNSYSKIESYSTYIDLNGGYNKVPVNSILQPDKYDFTINENYNFLFLMSNYNNFYTYQVNKYSLCINDNHNNILSSKKSYTYTIVSNNHLKLNLLYPGICSISDYVFFNYDCYKRIDLLFLKQYANYRLTNVASSDAKILDDFNIIYIPAEL